MRSDLVGFLGVVALITVTPGADTALVVRTTLKHSLGGGVVTAAGSAAGLLCWGATAAVGLAALLATSAAAFTTVKIAGAAYLIYLGVQSLRASRGSLAAVSGGSGRPVPLPPSTAFRQGLTTNLLNPKAALFFTALLPQFVAPQDPATVFAAMTLIASAASLGGLSLYAALVARGAHVLRRPSVARWLDRVTGAVFIALGVRVALEKR